MSEWRTMDSAPKDGTPIQARIPGNGDDNIIAWIGGYIDEDENGKPIDCCAWTVIDEQEPPDCWTDGVCWRLNEDLKPSVRPTHWKPYPAHQGGA